MKRKQVRPMRRGGFPIIFFAVLLTGLALASQAGTPPAQAAPVVQGEVDPDDILLEVVFEAFPQSKQLCVGQTYNFLVTVRHTVTISTFSEDPDGITRRRPVQSSTYYSGQVVQAVVQTLVTPGVGKISPRLQITSAGRPNFLEFEFTALKKGNTYVRFVHTFSDLPDFIPLADDAEIPVTVTDCYEAISGGVGSTFTKKDICSFEEPFVLEGISANIGNTGSNLDTTTFFLPFPQTPSQPNPNGWFANADILTAGQVTCATLTSGTYGAVYLPQNEVNITLKGRGSTYCWGGGRVSPPMPVANIGSQIKVKPALVCQGP